jgi:fibrillarin-like pre-rRNA processing protein
MRAKERFPGIWLIDDKLAVVNQIAGYRPFGEQLAKIGKREYRLWDPSRSKAAAAIIKGLKAFPVSQGDKILYLGIAHGFTASFLSAVIGSEGIIYGIEFASRPFTELLPICEKLKNIVPIFADARMPEKYSWIERVDVLYEDVAQPDMVAIAIRNCKAFLKPRGYLLLALKTRSIDVTRSPRAICDEEIAKLRTAGFEIVDRKSLEPFEDAHYFILARMR